MLFVKVNDQIHCNEILFNFNDIENQKHQIQIAFVVTHVTIYNLPQNVLRLNG